MYKKSEKLRALRHVMETGKQEYHAVRDIGMTQKQLRVWADADPRIARYRKALKERCSKRRIDMVVDANFKSAIEGNVAAQCFFLKNKAGWKDAIEHSGKIDGPETRVIIVRSSADISSEPSQSRVVPSERLEGSAQALAG